MSDNEEVLRSMYDLWNEGGPTAASELWAEDLVVHDFPEMPDVTVTHSREETLRLWEGRSNEELKITLDPVEVTETEPGRLFATMRIHIHAIDTGIDFEETHYHVIRMADGLMTEARFFRDLSDARAAADLPPE